MNPSAHFYVLLTMKAADLQEYLCTLEERLLHPDREPNRDALIPLLSKDFQEFCSSGRIMSRQQAIEAIQNSTPRAATISYFYVHLLAPDVALATYHTTTALHTAHRSSLWVYRENRWQLLFHQATIAV